MQQITLKTIPDFFRRYPRLIADLTDDGYPDVQAFMATYRKAESVVDNYNRELAKWERKVKENRRPAEKEQRKPSEKESVRNKLRQLQTQGKQKREHGAFDRER